MGTKMMAFLVSMMEYKLKVRGKTKRTAIYTEQSRNCEKSVHVVLLDTQTTVSY